MRYQKQLIKDLGPNYEEKINSLRTELQLLLDTQQITLFVVSMATELYISTIRCFLMGKNNIAYTTYQLLRLYVDLKSKKI